MLVNRNSRWMIFSFDHVQGPGIVGQLVNSIWTLDNVAAQRTRHSPVASDTLSYWHVDINLQLLVNLKTENECYTPTLIKHQDKLFFSILLKLIRKFVWKNSWQRPWDSRGKWCANKEGIWAHVVSDWIHRDKRSRWWGRRIVLCSVVAWPCRRSTGPIKHSHRRPGSVFYWQIRPHVSSSYLIHHNHL